MESSIRTKGQANTREKNGRILDRKMQNTGPKDDRIVGSKMPEYRTKDSTIYDSNMAEYITRGQPNSEQGRQNIEHKDNVILDRRTGKCQIGG
jgi:hypothetical protein